MKGGRQYMKFGLEKISDIVEKIYDKELPYEDSVIIGDNSSGKTMLLKLFIEQAGDCFPVDTRLLSVFCLNCFIIRIWKWKKGRCSMHGL